MRIRILCYVLAMLPLVLLRGQSQPSVDHHQHLFNPANIKLSPGVDPITASDLVALLDLAGIRRALVLSVAYQFGNPNRPPIDNEYAMVKAENDWTSQQSGALSGSASRFLWRQPAQRLCESQRSRAAPEIRSSISASSCTLGILTLTSKIQSTLRNFVEYFARPTSTGWRLSFTCGHR
jgi:hypothetical protein